jgi:hypothetical protein
VATPHDERLREFQKLIDAATRQLRIQRAAREALKEKEEKGEET